MRLVLVCLCVLSFFTGCGPPRPTNPFPPGATPLSWLSTMHTLQDIDGRAGYIKIEKNSDDSPWVVWARVDTGRVSSTMTTVEDQRLDIALIKMWTEIRKLPVSVDKELAEIDN